MMSDWREAIDGYLLSIEGELRAIRRHLHTHPEPSRQEFRTTQFLAKRLDEANIPHRIAPSGRGLIADSDADGDASTPRVAIRADLDALLLHDAKEVSYRSGREGVMHACGHDAHTAMALGAILALQRARDQLPGSLPWRAIFQPSEEVGEGAHEMIAAGALHGVRSILALHVDPDREVGRVGMRPGPLTAFCDDLHVTIRGSGGHAARPHQTIDPIATAAQWITTVYQSVPRSIDAHDPVVVTFGAIAGGGSPNVIPDAVTIQGTLRTLNRRATALAKERIQAIARGLAEASGARITIDFRDSLDGVVNDPAVTAAFGRAANEVVGEDRVDLIPQPSLGGEDFAHYQAHVPGCLLRLGVAAPDAPRTPLHSPRFDIDERALILGARVLARGVVLLSGGHS
jgi:amidohydrolase